MILLDNRSSWSPSHSSSRCPLSCQGRAWSSIRATGIAKGSQALSLPQTVGSETFPAITIKNYSLDIVAAYKSVSKYFSETLKLSNKAMDIFQANIFWFLGRMYLKRLNYHSRSQLLTLWNIFVWVVTRVFTLQEWELSDGAATLLQGEVE